MEWILDHLQLVLLAAGAVAYWLNQRRRERQGQSADYDEDGRPENRPQTPPAMDFEEAERTRRIQEEIRRKIMERRGHAPSPPPEVAPRPVAVPPLPELREILRPRHEPEAHAMQQETLDRQRALAAQMEDLAAQREAARRLASQAAAAAQAQASRAVAATASAKWREERDWRATLRNPESARRAIVLREVLGPPVGLR